MESESKRSVCARYLRYCEMRTCAVEMGDHSSFPEDYMRRAGLNEYEMLKACSSGSSGVLGTIVHGSGAGQSGAVRGRVASSGASASALVAAAPQPSFYTVLRHPHFSPTSRPSSPQPQARGCKDWPRIVNA